MNKYDRFIQNTYLILSRDYHCLNLALQKVHDANGYVDVREKPVNEQVDYVINSLTYTKQNGELLYCIELMEDIYKVVKMQKSRSDVL
jgi:hypothetical protein